MEEVSNDTLDNLLADRPVIAKARTTAVETISLLMMEDLRHTEGAAAALVEEALEEAAQLKGVCFYLLDDPSLLPYELRPFAGREVRINQVTWRHDNKIGTIMDIRRADDKGWIETGRARRTFWSLDVLKELA